MITELRKINLKKDTRGTPTHLIMSLMLIIIHVLVIIVTSFPLKSHYPLLMCDIISITSGLLPCSSRTRGRFSRRHHCICRLFRGYHCSSRLPGGYHCICRLLRMYHRSSRLPTIPVGLGWFGCRLAFATAPLSSVIRGKERSASIESKVV